VSDPGIPVRSGEFEVEASSLAKPPPPPAAIVGAPARAAAGARPPPVPAAAGAAGPPPPPPKLELVAPREERISFPSVPGGPVSSLGAPPARAPRRRNVSWAAGLAAAAAVGLGIFATTTVFEQRSPVEVASTPLPGQSIAQEAPAEAPSSGAVPGTAALARDEGRGEGAAPVTTPTMPAPAAEPAPVAAGVPPTSPAAVAAPSPPPQATPRGGTVGAADSPWPEERAARGLAEAAREPEATASSARRRAPARSEGSGTTSAPMRLPQPDPVSRSPTERDPTLGGRSSATPRAPIDEELEGALGEPRRGSGGGGGGGGGVPDLGGPRGETPTRAQVLAAMEAITPAVRACADDSSGTATVLVIVAGSGRVTTAEVRGFFAGTPQGSCIARAVRGAHLPPFTADRFEFTYPFTLAAAR
jgi:hypothetical protein